MNLRCADFSRPATAADGIVYHPFEDRGPLLRLPKGLRIARDERGAPELRLALTRNIGCADEQVGGGSLDMRLVADYGVFAEGEAPLAITGGTLRLSLPAAAPAQAALLVNAGSIEWLGGSQARLLVRLDAAAARRLESLLACDPLQLDVIAEVEVEGICARIVSTATIDVRTLLHHLRTDVAVNQLVRRDDLLVTLAHTAARCGLWFDPPLTQDQLEPAAQLLVDRLRHRLLAPAPSPHPDFAPVLRLPAIEGGLPERMVWNLAAATVAARPLLLRLSAPQDLSPWRAADGRLAQLQRVSVAPLASGFKCVKVDVNLPACRSSSTQLLATLRIPANPPLRPHPIERCIELSAQQGFADLDLRLGADEPPHWQLTTTAVIHDGPRTRRMNSEPVRGSGERVMITPSMLPVQFVHVQIGAALASIATIDVRAEALCDAATGVDHATLGAHRMHATLILPRSVRIGELVVRATPLGPGEPIEVGRYPLADRYVDITDCPTWGRQSVEIHAQFAADDELAVIDVRRVDSAHHETVTLTSSKPLHRIEWRCINPFRCGIEWRWHGAGRAECGPWSLLRRGTTLMVNPRQRQAA